MKFCWRRKMIVSILIRVHIYLLSKGEINKARVWSLMMLGIPSTHWHADFKLKRGHELMIHGLVCQSSSSLSGYFQVHAFSPGISLYIFNKHELLIRSINCVTSVAKGLGWQRTIIVKMAGIFWILKYNS